MALQSKLLKGYALLMQRIKKICATQNQARYKVIRGGVNWARFDFVKNPFAIAIVVDERTFNRAINTAHITFEMMVRMADDPEKASDTGIDDDVMDTLTDDMVMIVEEVNNLVGDQNQKLVLRVHQGTEKLLEISDADKMVQGVLVTIALDYPG